jgi:hypothetical protein
MAVDHRKPRTLDIEARATPSGLGLRLAVNGDTNPRQIKHLRDPGASDPGPCALASSTSGLNR